tara:strand:- start:193 stop:678 length:486 start_codon:yes stop_codon:yes gene_type:complete
MKTILTKEQIEHKILRMSFEIIETNLEEKELELIGLEKNGFIIAKKIGKYIAEKSNLKVNVTKMSLNKKNKNEATFSQKINPGKKTVILIDDVLKSGETIIYAIKELLSYNIKKLKTAILINRNHNIFPVGVNYVGLELSTTLEEHIQVVFGNKKNGAFLN